VPVLCLCVHKHCILSRHAEIHRALCLGLTHSPGLITICGNQTLGTAMRVCVAISGMGNPTNPPCPMGGASVRPVDATLSAAGGTHGASSAGADGCSYSEAVFAALWQNLRSVV
jgi:hypothetical protein